MDLMFQLGEFVINVPYTSFVSKPGLHLCRQALVEVGKKRGHEVAKLLGVCWCMRQEGTVKLLCNIYLIGYFSFFVC